MGIRYAEVLILTALALASDIRHYKIKNKLTFSFVFIGIVTRFVLDGLDGLLDSFLGIAAPFFILILLYALRMLGAGDIKLFSAIGAVMGFREGIQIMIYSFLAGGVIAVIIVIVNRNAKQRFLYIFKYLKYTFVSMSIQPYTDFEQKEDKAKFKMAYAIGCGVIIFIVVDILLK
ncbi:MAG: prepilin peptidase [Clostridium sp.]|nr:prepilin peptidase [Clostridium sp.]